jgi:hypothetical protein
VSALPELLNAYFPNGVRFMLVLLEDDFGTAPDFGYCQSYAAKYGLDTDKMIVAIDPLKTSLAFYDSSNVSLSVITDRQGKIVFKDEITKAGPFKWQIDWELKKLCDELMESGMATPYGDDVVAMCGEYNKELPIWDDPAASNGDE